MQNKEKLKILYLITTLQKGGAERIVIDICNELKNSYRESVETLIVTLKDKNDYAYLSNDLQIVNINSWVHLSFLKKTTADIERFKNIVKEFKPDIIHSHLFIDEIVARYYLFQGVTYVTHLHGYDFKYEKFNIKTIFSKFKLISYLERNWLIKKYIKCDNYFIAISEYSQKEMRRMLPQKLKNIYLLNNAIDFNKFYFEKQRIIEEGKCIKLITVGSLRTLKNHPFLIDVVRILLNKGMNVCLDIFGKGENKDNIQKKIDDLKLSHIVTLKGTVDNIESILPNYDLYVHSSFSESFGLTSLEAMASGLPVISLDGKGNRDIIKDGLNGFLIAKHDPVEFADKILYLMSNQVLYSRLSNNAIEFAKKFDIKNYCKKLLNLYELAKK